MDNDIKNKLNEALATCADIVKDVVTLKVGTFCYSNEAIDPETKLKDLFKGTQAAKNFKGFVTIIDIDGDITNYLPEDHLDPESALYKYHISMLQEARQLYSERAKTLFELMATLKGLLHGKNT